MNSTNNNPIQDKYLSRNDVFALKFNNGLSFLKVQSWEQYKYDPYSEIGTVAPQSASGFQRLEDENGDDILYVDENERKVLHVSIGHNPEQLRRYTNYPESENRLRTIPNLTVPRPVNGDDYGYVDGNDTPYSMPTDAEELMIPPGHHLDFSFYNPDQTKSHKPILNIFIREYDVSIIDPSENLNMVQRVVSPGSPMPTYPVGSNDNQSRIGTLAEEWGVRPVEAETLRGN